MEDSKYEGAIVMGYEDQHAPQGTVTEVSYEYDPAGHVRTKAQVQFQGQPPKPGEIFTCIKSERGKIELTPPTSLKERVREPWNKELVLCCWGVLTWIIIQLIMHY